MIRFSWAAKAATLMVAFGFLSPATAAPLGVESFDEAWRILKESYFDPSFNRLDWDAVRVELRPKAEAAKTTAELRPVIEEMLKRLDASHMALIPSEPTSDSDDPDTSKGLSGNGELGLDFRIVGERALVTRVDADGPADRAGIKPGWIIRSADDAPLGQGAKPAKPKVESRREEFLAWKRLTERLSGPPQSSARLECLDGADRVVSVTAVRRAPEGQPAQLGFLPPFYAQLEGKELPLEGRGKAGMIRFNLWMVTIIAALDQQIERFRHADGMIIDLRGNLGGLGGMVLGVSGHFLGERIALGTLKMRGSDLTFFANPRRVNAAGQRVEPFSGPLAILIDSMTLSAAEIFAGGMQAVGRARLFGDRSGGQALPAIWDRLPNGDLLYHAFGDFITASGARLEGHGVLPDEVAPTTREDLLAGRDVPMLRALAWIDEQKSKAEAKKQNP